MTDKNENLHKKGEFETIRVVHTFKETKEITESWEIIKEQSIQITNVKPVDKVKLHILEFIKDITKKVRSLLINSLACIIVGIILGTLMWITFDLDREQAILAITFIFKDIL